MKKVNLNEKGITLVALIITVIILVVLAAVTIISLQQSKMIEYAVNGTQNYAMEQQSEKNTIDELGAYLENALDKIKDANNSGGAGDNNDPEEDKDKRTLVIESILHNFNSKPINSTMVLDIRGEKDGTIVYSDTVTITHKGEEKKSISIKNLPIGTYVTASIVYNDPKSDLMQGQSEGIYIEENIENKITFEGHYTGRNIMSDTITWTMVYDDANGVWTCKAPDITSNSLMLNSSFNNLVTNSSIENTSDINMFIRVKAICSQHLIFTDNFGKYMPDSDNYWYYSDLLTPGTVSDELNIEISDIQVEEPEKKFTLCIVFEAVEAFYDDDNNPYADWNFFEDDTTEPV